MDFLDRTKPKLAPERTAAVRFLVLCGPRTGSSYLTSLLDSHPSIVSYSELFHPEQVALGSDRSNVPPSELLDYRRREPVRFIETVYGTVYCRTVIAAGFKLLHGHAQAGSERALWDWLERHDDVRILHLMRDNLLAQLLSMHQAAARGQWTAGRTPDGGPLRVTLAPAECEAVFRGAEQNRERARSRFRSHPYLEVQYEDLVAHSRVALQSVLSFLAVDNRELSTELVRMNPWPLEKCIANFDELARRFDGTPWGRFFWT